MNVQEILTDRQKTAFSLLCDQNMYSVLYGGGRSGKSMVIMIYIIMLCLVKPSRHLIVRKYLSDLIKSVWFETLPKALQILEIPPECYKMNSNMHTIFFSNGSEIWMGGMENQKSQDKVLGKEYTTAWVNEASEFDFEVLSNIRSRLAQSAGWWPKMMFDFNPPETSHWSFDFVMEKTLNGVYNVDVQSLHMNPVDNQENINPAYLSILESMPERQRKRFLLGEFCTPDESLFNEGMLIENVEGPQYYRKIVIGIDPAATEDKKSDETGIIVKAEDLDDRLFLLADKSGKYSPEAWADHAIDQYLIWEKMAREVIICAEVNMGGDMVGSVIKAQARKRGVTIQYKAVRTSVSKMYRAEEYSIILATRKLNFLKDENVTNFKKQLYGYTNVIKNGKSPDRVDAAIVATSQISRSSKILYFTA